MEKAGLPRWRRILNIFNKLFMIGWSLVIIYVLYLLYPTAFVVRSISKIPVSYFEIEVVNGNQAHYIQTKKKPDQWVELPLISKRLRGAIISSEDGKFFHHPGYDIEELQDAIKDGVVKKRKKVRGASTITQQLIKNLYFQQDRSLWRKTKEMAMTLLIEDKVSKEKILETYLNIIEYGEKIFGIKAASLFYFKKLPKDLNARESAFLAMLLPSPKRYSQSFRRRQLTGYAQKTMNSILFKMLQGGYIGAAEYEASTSSRMSWEKGIDSVNPPVDLALKEPNLLEEPEEPGSVNADDSE